MKDNLVDAPKLQSHIPFDGPQHLVWASLVTQRVKNLPAMQETRLRSLGQEDPLEEEMVGKTPHSKASIWDDQIADNWNIIKYLKN